MGVICAVCEHDVDPEQSDLCNHHGFLCWRCPECEGKNVPVDGYAPRKRTDKERWYAETVTVFNFVFETID